MHASSITTKSFPPVICPVAFTDAASLSALLGTRLVFADETKQHTGSFKFRAAYNLAANIEQSHVIASSSGNFAQALAYACALLNKKCTVVMPINSAQVKIDGVRKYGGSIEFVDTDKKGRAERLTELAAEYPDAYATNAYDNQLIIEGTKGLAQEIVDYPDTFDYVISPIGGGGLISGIILGIKESKKNNTVVIGAEPEMANDAALSIKAGRLIANAVEPKTIADGARTISLGKENWQIVRDNLKQIIEVPDEKIREAVRLLYQHLGLKAEPTGALSLAAVLSQPDQFKGKTVCCIVSGGNIDEKVFESILSFF